ncbi:hypothetical protein BH09ACT10_BH09ACT10_00080 [soil metagenome]
MNSTKYPLFAVAVVVGGGFALWAGLSPFFLIFLVACPLMMFFMMRGGMHGVNHGGHGESEANHRSAPARPSDLDGSHERIDRP